MPNKVCFIGHRKFLPPWLAEQLKLTVEQTIKDGCWHFSMGTHGDFDRLALTVCRQLKSQYPTLKIEMILTNPPHRRTTLFNPTKMLKPLCTKLKLYIQNKEFGLVTKK